MEPHIRSALESERRTGIERRLEIWFHNVDGHIYITGMPGKRSWYANLLANPSFTFHLKESVIADLPVTATPVTAPVERRRLFGEITKRLGHAARLEDWVSSSPLIEVLFT